MALLATTPSPLWFATRGSGWVALALLTLTVTLGILTAGGARHSLWPRFLSEGLHRNLSLLSIAFLAIHIITAIADPFARLAWRDAVVPFVSSYRPFWLGLGAVAMEIIAAMVLTSLARNLIGFRSWRFIHWAAHGAWPIALIHSLGTGSDARAAWSIGLTTACIASVLAASGWRLATWPRVSSTMRLALALSLLIFAGGVSGWAADGPLHPGWARRAGTPVALLGGGQGSPATGATTSPSAVASPATVSSASSTIQEPLTGEYVKLPGGQVRLMLTDTRDPSLQIVVRSAAPGEPGPVLAMIKDGQLGCVTRVAVAQVMGATCGKTRILIELASRGNGTAVAGWLVIEGA